MEETKELYTRVQQSLPGIVKGLEPPRMLPRVLCGLDASCAGIHNTRGHSQSHSSRQKAARQPPAHVLHGGRIHRITIGIMHTQTHSSITAHANALIPQTLPIPQPAQQSHKHQKPLVCTQTMHSYLPGWGEWCCAREIACTNPHNCLPITRGV